jgi:hypothetical protein
MLFEQVKTRNGEDCPVEEAEGKTGKTGKGRRHARASKWE